MSYVSGGPARGADHTARLLISCPDGPGIVAAVSSFLFERGANIVASDQYSTHPEHGTFFMRTAFYLPELEHERKRVALMASREDHCLLDLLWRRRRGELDMDVICVISNHDRLRAEVE